METAGNGLSFIDNYIMKGSEKTLNGNKINEKKKTSRKCQIEAAAKYNRENVLQVKFSFNKKTDADIIEHLQPMYNKTAYIKELIREDIKKGGEKIEDQ